MTPECPNCGQPSAVDAQFCQACGARLSGANPLTPTLPIETASALAAAPEPALEGAPAAATQKFKALDRPGRAIGTPFLDKRLRITEQLQVNSVGLSFYVAEDRATLMCPICRQPAPTPMTGVCPGCGAVLDPPEWIPQLVLLKEAADPTALAGERLVAAAAVRHDGLVNILGAFEALPYPEAKPHGYVIAEFDHGISLGDVAGPQPESSALVWTWQLAEGLAALHARRITHRRVNAANVTISGERARLTNLNHAQALPDDPAAARRALQDDIDGLVDILAGLVANACVTAETARLTVDQQRPIAEPANPAAAATALARHLKAAYAAVRHPHEVVLQAVGRSDVGQVRSINEDTIGIVACDVVHLSRPLRRGAAIVADGMGGHASGEVASGQAVEAFLAAASVAGWSSPSAGSDPADVVAVLRGAVDGAAARVFEVRRSAGTDLGTTVVAAAWLGQTVHVAHCGDSRAYRVPAQGPIQPLTRDHSLARELVDAGQLDPEAVGSFEGRNFVTRSLGGQADPGFEFAPPVELGPGERIVLCSDGLTGKVDDGAIATAVRTAPSLSAACDALIAAANAAGGEDNVSVIILAAEAAGGGE